MSDSRRVVTVHFNGLKSQMTIYPGTSSEDIENHIRKIFQIEKKATVHLFEQTGESEVVEEEVVISDRLPNGTQLHLRVDATATATSKSQTVENFKRTDEFADVRICRIGTLLPPACLIEEIPMVDESKNTVRFARKEVTDILEGHDDRLIVIVGPCSIHDPTAAREYAQRLLVMRNQLKADLCIIMRVYFEKPRTTVGWKGLINDPDMNSSFQINKGLRIARVLLRDITAMGLPVGCEFLDTISPQFLADFVSWGAIGARTTECQLHRELASGLSMPVGFKNGTGGGLQMAVDAVVAANFQHCFLSVSTQGLSSIVQTQGNPHCHVILRGGSNGPNFSSEHVEKAADLCKKSGLRPNIMIDASHGNSQKNHNNQPLVCEEVGRQVANGSEFVCGLMIESNLKAGNQKIVPDQPLVYGLSVTDACIDWDTTVEVLRQLSSKVQQRRSTQQTRTK
eukprot:c5070_g1_i1.p1 GENE.c5070_g1_i1~~c5070_g1_i1.p1  ORF type:complete len:454 (-),score=116.59 c5070_g1_i1:51-1412(-)